MFKLCCADSVVGDKRAALLTGFKPVQGDPDGFLVHCLDRSANNSHFPQSSMHHLMTKSSHCLYLEVKDTCWGILDFWTAGFFVSPPALSLAATNQCVGSFDNNPHANMSCPCCLLTNWEICEIWGLWFSATGAVFTKLMPGTCTGRPKSTFVPTFLVLFLLSSQHFFYSHFSSSMTVLFFCLKNMCNSQFVFTSNKKCFYNQMIRFSSEKCSCFILCWWNSVNRKVLSPREKILSFKIWWNFSLQVGHSES